MSNVYHFEINMAHIEPSYCQFLDIVSPDSKIAQQELKKMDETIDIINDFFQQCINESEKHKKKLFTFNPTSLVGLRPQVKYATRKMESLQKKLVAFSEQYFIDSAKKLSRLVHFLKECQCNNYPVNVDILGLKHLVRDGHDNNPLNIKRRKRISILDLYANRLSKAPMVPNIPNEQIIAVAREVSVTVDPVTLHSVPSFLDDFIFYYISYHKSEREFDELVQKVSLNPKFINMRPFQPFVNRFVEQFGALEKNEIMVLRVAVARFFFERFFKTNSRLYIEQPEINEFISNCRKMSAMSPKELIINKKFVKDSDFEKPFQEIVENNNNLQNALGNLINANFYSYPSDILQCLYSAMKNTEDYVKESILEREFGTLDNIDWNSEAAILASSDLAFDDFFPIFSAVFSVGPMANALAIQHMLEMIEKLVIPTTFDFAKVVFMTTVSHIMNFNPSDYIKSNKSNDKNDEKPQSDDNVTTQQSVIQEKVDEEINQLDTQNKDEVST